MATPSSPKWRRTVSFEKEITQAEEYNSGDDNFSLSYGESNYIPSDDDDDENNNDYTSDSDLVSGSTLSLMDTTDIDETGIYTSRDGSQWNKIVPTGNFDTQTADVSPGISNTCNFSSASGLLNCTYNINC